MGGWGCARRVKLQKRQHSCLVLLLNVLADARRQPLAPERAPAIGTRGAKPGAGDSETDLEEVDREVSMEGGLGGAGEAATSDVLAEFE